MIEGRLFGLNYEGLLPGPMVLQKNEKVQIISGTSSLQGNLRRQVVVEMQQTDGDGDTKNPCSSRYAWICYMLEETRFNVHGPATALQVLQVRSDLYLLPSTPKEYSQAISRHIRDSIALHYIRAEVINTFLLIVYPSLIEETRFLSTVSATPREKSIPK